MEENRIYDSSHDKEYYKDLLFHEFKLHELLPCIIAGIITLSLGLWILVFHPSFKYVSLWVLKELSILLIFVGVFFFLLPVYIFKQNRMILKKGLFGVRIDEEGIWFFNRKKHWSYKDIDFLFIDEGYHPILGLIVIKTMQTPHVNITHNLMQNPKKFWSEIPWKDKTFNSWDTKMVKNLDEFIDALRYYDVKVYRRRKGSAIVEAVN